MVQISLWVSEWITPLICQQQYSNITSIIKCKDVKKETYHKSILGLNKRRRWPMTLLACRDRYPCHPWRGHSTCCHDDRLSVSKSYPNPRARKNSGTNPILNPSSDNIISSSIIRSKITIHFSHPWSVACIHWEVIPITLRSKEVLHWPISH